MTLNTRQLCSAKSVFRSTIAVLIFIIILVVYRLSIIPKSDYCKSSADCYQLFKEKATEKFRAYPAYPAYHQEMKSSYEDGPDQQNLKAMGVDMNKAPLTAIAALENSPVISKSEQRKSKKQQEYKVLTDATLPRIKGAFVVLARNSELYALRSSMRYMEDRFNHKYNYPWIFLNEQPFSEEFKNLTSMMTNAEVHYGLIPEEHWSYPDWIDQDYAAECRQDLEDQNVAYGGSESYRHMCRYQSGFFMMHPLLDGLDYYWRVEPGVKFSCDMDYDPFRVMQERDLKYGFTIALKEYESTIPSLWKHTLDFAKKHPQYIYPRTRPDSLLELISGDNGWSYNLCHFWSNFEIASVKFMRSEGYQSYFKYLDSQGGFFYERWGDAPVHSIAVALMLKKSDVHWFYDIGYKHDFFEHCPTEQKWLVDSKCYCDPGTSFDFDPGSCTPLFLDVMDKSASSFIITRPDDEV